MALLGPFLGPPRAPEPLYTQFLTPTYHWVAFGDPDLAKKAPKGLSGTVIAAFWENANILPKAFSHLHLPSEMHGNAGHAT